MSLEEKLTRARPEDDPIGAHAAEANILRRLAGVESVAPRIGRFRVLDRLGQGAHGVVYAAYDPKLNRRVALKLLRHKGEREHRRLVREARALARLTHPNVVAVYEAGEAADELFVAMEYVEGNTLDRWLGAGSHDAEEILEVVRAAGRGLAEAHAQGLVHRDFKPSNVMVGSDGRVRVTDFGLAFTDRETHEPDGAESEDDDLSTTATRTGAVLGTPAYMAPEQHAGQRQDPRSDQYAFCLVVWEALTGRHPFALAESEHPVSPARMKRRFPTLRALALAKDSGPGPWPDDGASVSPALIAVLRRGLAATAEQRWPSMDELLARLELRPVVRRWARPLGYTLLVGAGMGVAAGGWVGYREYIRTRANEACRASVGAIDEVWNEASRASVREGLTGSGVSQGSSVADRVMPRIDEHAEAWRAAATSACVRTHVIESWDNTTYDKAAWCLEESSIELDMLVGTLATADVNTALRAVKAAAALPAAAPCVDPPSLAVMPDPPPPQLRADITSARRQLARARLHKDANSEEALQLARGARERGEALSWPPLTSEARSIEASLLTRNGLYEEAEAVGKAAYMEAARHGVWGVAALAATDLTFVVGVAEARPGEGKAWAEHAAVAIAHAGDPRQLREASRLNHLGLVHSSKGELEEALTYLERGVGLLEQTLGPEHPQVATALNNLAVVHSRAGTHSEARGYYERALEVQLAALGPEHPEVASTMSNLGNMMFQTGNFKEAKRLQEQALAVQEAALGPEHSDAAAILVSLGIVHAGVGEYTLARSRYERAIEIYERALGADHPQLAGALTNLAVVLNATDEHEEAELVLERALTILETRLGPEHPDVGRILINLASASLGRGASENAVERYARAVTILEGAFGPEHPDIAHALGGLGRAFAAQGDRRKAIAHLERADHIRSEAGVPPAVLAKGRFALSRVLWNASPKEGRDRSRARMLAEQARGVYAVEGAAPPDRLAAVEAWLAAHPTSAGSGT